MFTRCREAGFARAGSCDTAAILSQRRSHAGATPRWSWRKPRAGSGRAAPPPAPGALAQPLLELVDAGLQLAHAGQGGLGVDLGVLDQGGLLVEPDPELVGLDERLPGARLGALDGRDLLVNDPDEVALALEGEPLGAGVGLDLELGRAPATRRGPSRGGRCARPSRPAARRAGRSRSPGRSRGAGAAAPQIRPRPGTRAARRTVVWRSGGRPAPRLHRPTGAAGGER